MVHNKNYVTKKMREIIMRLPLLVVVVVIVTVSSTTTRNVLVVAANDYNINIQESNTNNNNGTTTSSSVHKNQELLLRRSGSSNNINTDHRNLQQPRICRFPRFIGTWEETPAYPIYSAEPHGLLVGDDLVIFGGFYNTFTQTTRRTYARNVINVNSQWRRMEDIPHYDGITHTPTVQVNKKVYLCGGYVGGSPGPHTPDCYVYDHTKLPGTDQWSKIRQLPLNGTGGSGIIYDTPNNRLFYVGGAQRTKPGILFALDTPKVWKYEFDNPSDGWVKSTPIPYIGNHISYTTARDAMNRERHYFMGGQINENERTGNLDDVYEFNPQLEKWEPRTSMPYGRGHATASTRAIGCGFIIAGGAINIDPPTGPKQQTDEIYYYHIPFNNWTKIGNLPLAMVTPIVEIDRNGYMHFVDTRRNAFRRKIVF